MAKSHAKSEANTLTADTRVAILSGPERFLQDLHTNQLREALTKAHGSADAVQVVRFDGASPGATSSTGAGPLADILDECRSYGLMASYKLVIVDNADALLKSADDDEEEAAPAKALGASRGPRIKTAREVMESYAQQPSDSATLVLRASALRPGKLDKIVLGLGAAGAIIKCEPPTPADAIRWAKGRCSHRHGAKLADDAAALLIDLLGPDLGRIDAELAKLALVNPGQPVTIDTVREFVGLSREEKFFAIQGSLLSGKPAEALAHLHELVEVSRQDPVPINWAYSDLARKIHGLSRGMAQGEHPQSLMRTLKIWGRPDEVDRLIRTAKKLQPPAAARLLQAAIENDAALKTSQGDAVRNLEALTLRFTSTLA